MAILQIRLHSYPVVIATDHVTRCVTILYRIMALTLLLLLSLLSLAAADEPSVAVKFNDTKSSDFRVYIDGSEWFRSGILKVRDGGEWWSTESTDKNVLVPTLSVSEYGVDSIGAFAQQRSVNLDPRGRGSLACSTTVGVA